jgi:tetratricopeptide (TPR) repeat protein
MRDEGGPIWTLERGPIGALRLQRAQQAYERRDTREAVIEAEELLDEEPDNQAALLIVADGSLELGQPEVARVAYEQFLEIQTDDALAWAGLAVAFYEMADMPGCIEAAERSIVINPKGPEAWYYKGLALEHSGHRDQADLCYLQASRDGQSFPLVGELSDAIFAAGLGQALQALPAELREWFAGIELEVVELPDLTELRRSVPSMSPSAGALYIGEPNEAPWENPPDKVRLYRRNIARAASYGADLVSLIAHALRQEALDWLVLPDNAFPLADE